MEERLEVLVSETEIKERVDQLAREIRTTFEGQDLTVVGLLEDSFVFMADLIRAIDVPLQCCFMKATKHQSGGHSEIVYTTEFDPHATTVLLVSGILDTGVTLDYLVKQMFARGAKTVKSCVLVDKPNFRTTDFTPDFTGFTRSEAMVIGYGLGLGNSYRHLKYLAELKQS
jgi:hypoxanthine phosphoribosyltransferase